MICSASMKHPIWCWSLGHGDGSPAATSSHLPPCPCIGRGKSPSAYPKRAWEEAGKAGSFPLICSVVHTVLHSDKQQPKLLGGNHPPR